MEKNLGSRGWALPGSAQGWKLSWGRPHEILTPVLSLWP